MIRHADELHMIPPTGGSAVLMAVHVRREVLEAESRRLSADGWQSPEIVPCPACANHTPLPIAA